jgi:hypothetical protein
MAKEKTDKKNPLKKVLNTDTGAILFILGISALVVLIYKYFTGLPAWASFIVLIVAAVVFLAAGILVTLWNRKAEEYDPAEELRYPDLRSSVEKGMEMAWQDHHHARNQTWEALKLEALLAVALIGLDVSKAFSPSVPAIGSLLLFLLAVSGMMITLHHRELERRKFRHIMHCEDALGLRKYIDQVSLPSPNYIWDTFLFWKSNTILFIMRMHFAILVLSLVFLLSR